MASLPCDRIKAPLKHHLYSDKLPTRSLNVQTTEVLDGWNHHLGLTGATLPHNSFFIYGLVKASNVHRKQAFAVETFCEAAQ